MQKTFCSIDLFKFLAALLVVVIHTRPFYSNVVIDYYVISFCRVAVPFFFIATSFFFFSKEQPDIKKYTKRLAFLYIAWFIIELPFVYQRFFVDFDKSLPLQILNLLRCIVFSNTWYASWFIMASILSVNIIYWLSHKLKNRQLLVLSVLGYLISLACSSYNGAVDLLLNERMRHYHSTFSNIFMPANSFIVALIYVVLGKFVAERVQNNQLNSKPTNLLLFFTMGLLWGVEVYLIRWSASINDAFFFLPMFTLFGFTLLLQTNISFSPKVSHWFRDMSILIYILHPIFSSVNYELLSINYGWRMLVITLIETIVTANLLLGLSYKIPFIKKLY